MARPVGRKFVRAVRKIGGKFANNRARIGRKFAKAGRIAGRIAPFLSAVPLIGPELAMAAGGAAQVVSGVGKTLQARNARSAATSLVDTYAQHKAARRS